MGLELSKNILSINPSSTLAMVEEIEKARRNGREIIALNIGEPDFKTPDHINKAIISAINQGKTKYTSTAGIIELKSAIARKLKADNNLIYDENQIVVTTGAKQALYETISALVNEGDEVIIPTPCWVSYEEIVKACGGVCVFVKTNSEDFQLNISKIEEAISKKTKAIIINTPNNPTGAVYPKDILEQLAHLAIDNKFYVISDEIYEKLIYEGNEHFSIASLNQEIYQQTITINGFAKAYAMTGLRLGYLATTTELAKVISNLQTHLTSNTCTPIQYGGVIALEADQKFLADMVVEFKKRRELTLKLLSDIPDISFSDAKGAFYIMINIEKYLNIRPDIKSSNDLVMYLLNHANIALVSGEGFQAKEYIRLSYSNSIENLEHGLGQLKMALKTLKEMGK